MMRLTKSSFLFYFILQFKACVFTTILSPADRTLNGQDAELVCTYSTNIASTSTVYVNWLENGNIRGNIDNRCSDAGRPVDTTQYNFSCPSISNYTWTIKNAQESRNGTKWTCAIAIDSLTYTTSDPTTMYVISPITSVSIDGNANISADAKSQTTVSCTTSTGRPVSTIHWYFDAGTPLNTSDDEEITSASEPVFDFGSETTSGSVTITAESNRNRWGIYATANNTESMTPIRSSNAVTLTVTASIDPTPGGCKICKWFVIIPCCWCIVLIVIVVLIIIIIIAGGCTLGYWWYKGIYLFDTPRKWPCSSSKPPKVERSAAASHVEMSGNSSEKSNDVHKGLSGKPPDGERIASASHVEMGDISSEKSSFVPKGLSGYRR